MKTKRRTFWSFFTRIGAGFLAFWLAVMAVFTVLLSQQRAKLMLAEMESKSDKLMGEDTDLLLDPSSYDTTDETELRRRLSKPVFMADSADPPNLQIIETAITDLKSGKVLQSNRWWLELIEGDNLYRVDMSGQPREVCEAVLAGAGTGESKIESLPKMTFEAWADSVPGYRDDAYLKSITIEPTKSGTWEPTGEVRTIECAYDAEQVKGLMLKTMSCNRLVCPGPNGATTEQIAKSLSSPARQALREWAEYPSRTNSSQTVEKLWLVRTYRRTIRYCPFAESGAVLVSYAAEGYPLKALLPVLIPVWAFSLVLALFCAAVLSGAQLRVWRKQERVERVRRETTAALAHELKTPLSVLSATAELLGDNLAPEKQAHYLGVIRQQAQRMDGSVRQMLELSRLETGAKALRRTAFSLAELAQERLQAALPTDSTIHTEFAAQGEYEVNADRALLTRALDALLENAVQHTPEGGCITVHLADGVLSVTNTGDAIPTDALPRLGRRIIRPIRRAAQKATDWDCRSRKPCSICMASPAERRIPKSDRSSGSDLPINNKKPLERAVFALLNNLFEYHGCLNAVAAHQTLAAAVRCSNRVQAITLLRLMVNRFFQFGQVAGTGAEKFFLQSNLQDNVMIVLAGCGGESRGIAEIHK